MDKFCDSGILLESKMRTEVGFRLRMASNLLDGAICAVMTLLIVCSAEAQNLFVADFGNNTIAEIPPGGTPSIFTYALSGPTGLAFNNAGDLFEANYGGGSSGSGTITKYLSGGGQSTFASGLDGPEALAFNSAGNLFEADFSHIYLTFWR
jgi:hypothetical protein